MNISEQVTALFERLQEKEAQFESDLAIQRKEFQYAISKRRIKFDEAVRLHHKTLRISVRRFLRQSTIPATLVSPMVYLVIVPLVILDLMLFVYQLVCAPVYGIEKLRRSDYVILDRHKLAYLNPIEKLNCVYCGYANGLLSYARAIAGRAEGHWCPIKHALKTRGALKEYYSYADYGDAETYKNNRAKRETGERKVPDPDE